MWRATDREAREAAGARAVPPRVQRRERVRDCTDRGAAHVKHVIHVQDTGGDKSAPQRLVEGLRVLPRVASRAHGAGRGLRTGRRRLRGRAGRRLRLQMAAARGRGALALNMELMVVTRDVSQEEMSALKLYCA